MSLFENLVVVSSARWLAEDLSGAGVINVIPALGLELPKVDPETTAWWCPGNFIARAAATGVDIPVMSAGPHWLPSLGYDWRQRHVKSMRLSEVPLRFTGGFIKSAEIKINALPARVYTNVGAFLCDARDARLPEESWVQVSEPMNYLREYRCFIANGQVTAATPYLVDGSTWDALEPDSDEQGVHAASAFVNSMLAEIGTNCPPGFVVDAGLDDRGRWSVIEANASWSSNPYHSDPAGVIESILASHDVDGVHPEWAWSIDPYHRRYARPLPRA